MPALCSCCTFPLENIQQVCVWAPFWLWTSAAPSTACDPFPCGQVLFPHLWGRGLQAGGHQNQLSVFMLSDLPYLTLVTSLLWASRAPCSCFAFQGPSQVLLWTTLKELTAGGRATVTNQSTLFFKAFLKKIFFIIWERKIERASGRRGRGRSSPAVETDQNWSPGTGDHDPSRSTILNVPRDRLKSVMGQSADSGAQLAGWAQLYCCGAGQGNVTGPKYLHEKIMIYLWWCVALMMMRIHEKCSELI